MMPFSSPKPMAWSPEARTPDRERRVSEEARREIRRFDELAEVVASNLRELPPDDPMRQRILGILKDGLRLKQQLEVD
ncbi:hypothetical protein KBB27_03655 [Patescibacteria group bacterium]|nr:hypothetical protein [Patescibacteria group bacterium]